MSSRRVPRHSVATGAANSWLIFRFSAAHPLNPPSSSRAFWWPNSSRNHRPRAARMPEHSS